MGRKAKLRLIICGSSNVADYNLIDKAIDYFNINIEDIKEIVSGVDSPMSKMAVIWARNKQIKCREFVTNWQDITVPKAIVRENPKGKYNAVAGFNKNLEMVLYSNSILCLYDDDCGNNTFTEHLVDKAQEHELESYIYECKGKNDS